MKLKSDSIVIAVAFGSLWGLAEATIGTGLHLITRITGIPALAGMFMFPVALMFMHRAFVRSGSAAIIPATAAVAAAIKLTGLAIPGIPVMDTLNPALAILLEGAAGWAVIRMAKTPAAVPAPVVFVAAAGWKLVFTGVQLAIGVSSGIALLGSVMFLRFVVLDSAVNALVFAGLFRLFSAETAGATETKLEPAAATGMLFLAVMTNLGAMLVA